MNEQPTAAEMTAAEDQADADRTEQRRMWCLSQAIGVALSVQRMAPAQPAIDIMATAEEMVEFVKTGVARAKQVVPKAKQ